MEQVSGYGEGLGSRFQERRKKEESLRESEEHFRTMADTALIWTTDADKLCTYVSQTWLDLTGKIFEEELGNGWADDIHPSDRDARLEAYAHCFDQRSPFTLEYRVRRHDGEYRWLLDKGTPRCASDGTFLGYIGSATDITERKRVEERLRVQHTVAQILAEAATIEEATPRILRAMGECLGWDVGALWRVDREAEALRCVELWHKASIEVPEFERVSRELTFVPGLGLAGRVWSSLEPEYIPDVVPDENFPRGPIAEREGLHAAFGFPILLGGEVLGVIEFFSREIRQPDQELLNMLAAIGSQIGQFIERKRAEEAFREVQMQLAHANRVATMGQLSASIAHEVNQPLATVVMFGDACLRWLDREVPRIDKALSAVEQMIGSAKHASDVIEHPRAIQKARVRNRAARYKSSHQRRHRAHPRGNQRSWYISAARARGVASTGRWRPHPAATSYNESSDERHPSCQCGDRPQSRTADTISRARVRSDTRGGGGLRHRNRAGTCRPAVQRFLHDEAGWHGHGTIDLPLDHRSPRWPAVGHGKRTPGCHVSVHPASEC